MLYRDFMEKYRPLYAPDEPAAAAPAGSDGAAAPASGPTDAAAASPTAAAQDAAPGAAAPATPPAGDAAAKPDSTPTLLEAADGKKPDAKPEGEGKKDDPAPAEAAKPDAKDAKADGDKPEGDATKDKDGAAATDPDKKDATAEAPPAPIKYEAFKLPEGVKLDDKKIQEFSELAGAAQVKQEDAQKLLDLYVAEVPRLVSELRAEQRQHWDKLNDTWKTDTRNDPELGGNRLETSLSMAKAFIEEYGGTREQVSELLAHLNNNGMGNFAGFIRLAHNAARALNIFEDKIVPANPQAPKASKGPGQRGWYDKSLNAPQ